VSGSSIPILPAGSFQSFILHVHPFGVLGAISPFHFL
jgi:hypothetical protein